MKERKEQRCQDLARLTNRVTRIEEEMVWLRKKYDRAIQQQNERYTCKFDVIWCLILACMNQQYFSTYELPKLGMLKGRRTVMYC